MSTHPLLASTCWESGVPLCQRVGRIPTIFVGKVAEKATRGYRVLIEEAFKGLPADTHEVLVHAGALGGYTVGATYLFATSSPLDNGSPGIHLAARSCDTTQLERAAEDLRFIREYVSNPQPARLAITVSRQSRWGSSEYPPIPGVKLNIRAGKLDWTLMTDAAGKAELNPTLPGTYTLVAELAGHKAIRTDFAPTPLVVTIPPHGCGAMSIGMHTDARISGRVLSHDGKPVSGVEVEYAFADPRYRRAHLPSSSSKTDRDGWFHLEGAPSGDVVVGVNITKPPTADQPYRTILHTLHLTPNDNRTNVVLRLGAPLKQRYVSVRPRWTDGSISTGAFVDARVAGIRAESIRSGPKGLTFKLLEGVRYTISAHNERSITGTWRESKTITIPAFGPQIVDLVIDTPRR